MKSECVVMESSKSSPQDSHSPSNLTPSPNMSPSPSSPDSMDCINFTPLLETPNIIPHFPKLTDPLPTHDHTSGNATPTTPRSTSAADLHPIKMTETLDEIQKTHRWSMQELVTWRNVLLCHYAALLNKDTIDLQAQDFDESGALLNIPAQSNLSSILPPPSVARTVIRLFEDGLKLITVTLYFKHMSLQLIWKVDENGCLDSQILADSVHYSPKGLSLFLREVKSALWERQQNPVASYAAAVKGQRMSSPQTSPHDIGETSQSTQQPLSPRSQHPPMSQQPPQDAVTLHSPQQQYETVQPCHRPQHQCVPDQHSHRPQHQYVPEQPSQPPRSTEVTALAPGGTQPPHHRWFHPFPVLDPSGYFHAPPGPHNHFHQPHYPPHLLHPSMYSAFSPFVQQAPPPFYSQWPMPQATM